MKAKKLIAAIVCISLVACSTTPRVVVDPASIKDQQAYETDLESCTKVADSFNRDGDTAVNTAAAGLAGGTAVAGVAAAVAGAVFLPAIPFIAAGALLAGGTAGGATKASERETKDKIVTECMNDKGYKAYKIS